MSTAYLPWRGNLPRLVDRSRLNYGDQGSPKREHVETYDRATQLHPSLKHIPMTLLAARTVVSVQHCLFAGHLGAFPDRPPAIEQQYTSNRTLP